ncbi:cyclin-J [Zophobas morio]|uniref:cyclin-J n=1 Tax=Zophobas morio TaxID=2755281 RepID=UPI0030829200
MSDLMTSNSAFYVSFELRVPSNCEGCDEYEEDFKQVIKEQEKKRIFFQHRSPQISFRKHLVQHLKNICGEKSLSRCCLHLSVYLLDIFMDNHKIAAEKLLLVGNVCLLLAAKFEEHSAGVPKISELNAFVDNKYEVSDYNDVEILVLKFYQFFLKFPCAAHHVFYYINEMISLDDVNGETTFRTLFFDVFENIKMYLNWILDDIHYVQYYQPSKLAAAIIAASRIQNGLVPWTKQLEDSTTYTEGQFEEILQNLLKKNVLYCAKCDLPNLTNTNIEI